MTQTKHTAGEWKIEGDDIVGERYICKLADWSIVGQGGSYDDVNKILQKEREANARLIASAPDLLEACKAIANDSNNEECSMQNIRYIVKTLVNPAIAKAEGQQ